MTKVTDYSWYKLNNMKIRFYPSYRLQLSQTQNIEKKILELL